MIHFSVPMQHDTQQEGITTLIRHHKQQQSGSICFLSRYFGWLSHRLFPSDTLKKRWFGWIGLSKERARLVDWLARLLLLRHPSGGGPEDVRNAR